MPSKSFWRESLRMILSGRFSAGAMSLRVGGRCPVGAEKRGQSTFPADGAAVIEGEVGGKVDSPLFSTVGSVGVEKSPCPLFW